MVFYLALLISTGVIAPLAAQHLAICVYTTVTNSLTVEVAKDNSAINSRSGILLGVYGGYGGSVHSQPGSCHLRDLCPQEGVLS
jgi:hypothetical protein